MKSQPETGVYARLDNAVNGRAVDVLLSPPSIPGGMWWITEADYSIALAVIRGKTHTTTVTFQVRDRNGWAVATHYSKEES